MKKHRSLCPLARSLDLFGDKWTLLILRDVSIFGKKTFKELSTMPERIASNTLAERLERLTAHGLLTKSRRSHNKLVFNYEITQKGMDLIPVIKSVFEWSEKYLYDEQEKEEAAGLLDLVKSQAFMQN